MDKSQTIRGGFTAKQVVQLLEISPSKLRYWRDKLDPMEKRTFFTWSDIFIFGILKVLIVNKGTPVKELKKADCSSLFQQCRELNRADLKKYIVTFNHRTSELKLSIHSSDQSYISNSIKVVYLDLIGEELQDAIFQY